jgi:hypothetical protein
VVVIVVAVVCAEEIFVEVSDLLLTNEEFDKLLSKILSSLS